MLADVYTKVFGLPHSIVLLVKLLILIFSTFKKRLNKRLRTNLSKQPVLGIIKSPSKGSLKPLRNSQIPSLDISRQRVFERQSG